MNAVPGSTRDPGRERAPDSVRDDRLKKTPGERRAFFMQRAA